MKKIISLVLVALMITALFTACGANKNKDDKVNSSETTSKADNNDKNNVDNEFLKANFPSDGNADILNIKEPTEGETIAIVNTNMGEFRIRFFNDVAPKAVENFISLSNQGKYNNTKLFRIVSNFVIQGGDITNTGSGFESSYGEMFEDEFSEKALNLRGAVGMANQGEADTNGCQFYVVQAPSDALVTGIWDILEKKQEKVFPKKVQDLYEELGGTPWLDFSHTVFGQVYAGMDTIDAISKVQTDSNDIPLEDVFITSVQITQFTLPAENTETTSDTSSEALSE